MSGCRATLALAAVIGIGGLCGCGGGGGDSRSPSSAGTRAQSDSLRAEARDEAIKSLRQAVTSEDAQTRANAYEALELDPEALRGVAGMGLLDENVGVRAVAALVVGRAGLAGHEPALRAMLADESPYAQASAIFALAKLGHDVDRSPMAVFLMQGDPPGVRGHTAYLLGELGDPSAVGLLRSAAEVPMELASQAERRLVELQLSEAMVKLGERDQLGTIRAALFPSQASDLEAMALAIQIVGEVGDRASRGRLVQIAQTEDANGQTMPPEVQLAIAISMAKLGDQQGWFVADEFWDSDREVVRADSAAVYGWSGRDVDIRRLQRMLRDPSGRVRVAAAAGILRATR